jgi:RHS repeat-associated protein
MLESTQLGDAMATYSYAADGQMQSATDELGTRDLRREGASIAALQVTYDDLGRVVQRGELELSYGPDGQLARATRGEKTWAYFYDEAGQRVLKLEDEQLVLAFLSGSVLTSEHDYEPIRVGGRVVGVLEDGHFVALPTDERGTVIADADGSERLPSAFGVRSRDVSLRAVVDYAEKAYDADLGFVRMGVRDYDPLLGAFTTPDPLLFQDLSIAASHPIDANLYGYARGNPLTFTDPTGLLPPDGASTDRAITTLAALPPNEKLAVAGLATMSLVGGLGLAAAAPAALASAASGFDAAGAAVFAFGCANPRTFELGMNVAAGLANGPVPVGWWSPAVLPQGISQANFSVMSGALRIAARDLGDDIVVHGSRAAFRARPDSDIDIAIRVTPERFAELIQKSFPRGALDNSIGRTMQHAVATGKIQRGEIGLSDVGEGLKRLLGMKVDISVIKIGGPFDNGPMIPLAKQPPG